MTTLLDFLLSRLKEPSTYAGLGALVAAAGWHPSQDVLSAITNAGVAVAGLAAILLPETGKKP